MPITKEETAVRLRDTSVVGNLETYHQIKLSVSDLFKCSHGEEKGKKFTPPDKDLDMEEPDEKQVQQKVVLDAIDDVPALLQHSQHNDPSLCKLNFRLDNLLIWICIIGILVAWGVTSHVKQHLIKYHEEIFSCHC